MRIGRTNCWVVGAAVVALAGAACNREPLPEDPAAREQQVPDRDAGADARASEAPPVAADQADTDASAAWITTKIQAQYFVNPEVKPWNIDVTTTSDGVVTLRGEVDAAEDRTEAVRIARETEGVLRVEDNLRVRGEPVATAGAEDRGAPGMESPDAWVTTKIQAKYFTDPDVRGLDIDVNTENGVVTLQGEVESPAERRQAVALARNTDGVRDVQDQLRLQGGEEQTEPAATTGSGAATAVDDTWITTKIQSKYFLDADVKGHEINVDTQNGVVTLQGSVASQEERQTAEEIARETQGVSRVENQLTVAPAQGQ